MAAGDEVPWSYIATRVATGSLTADSSTYTGTESGSLLSVSPVLVSGRTYAIRLMASVGSDAVTYTYAATNIEVSFLRIREDTSTGTQLGQVQVYIPTTSSVGFPGPIYAEYTAVSTGAKTFVVTGTKATGSGSANHRIRAATSRPAWLTVDLIPV